ncbi:hypothetical protein KBTX_01013 [wastewater metagenome]|uniref:Peptidase S54 rhomboid domain-containing protein n=2 Tax=unclassified sequences TaxID=12908 RepID=A0A5B8RD52_9ZZZZ|nr:MULTISPECIES: rhomboid family intramembrane serine protease [Arhodomonas]MCS4503756.1 rhomboid family intramembrane serine protease [Arhodomonas aquaeolei]QEA04705.1 hypothetical protein KBTEX_01013 [uncultured organism]
MLQRDTSLPPAVFALLVVNALVFGAEQLIGMTAADQLALWPLGTPDVARTATGLMRVPDFAVWQLVTYGFLHGGLFHLFVNMFALWMFGTPIERTLGTRAFTSYYFVCLVGAGLIQLVVATMAAGNGMIYPTVGASGAVFGILLAFGMFFPNQQVILIFPPIPMKAKYFVILYGAFELFAGVTNTFSGVAHFAHLGGMAFGFVMILYWRGRLPIKPRRRLNL